jgi:hypothetical protein
LELPARRAGTLMIVLGVLAALLGILSAYRANTFDPAELNSVPEARKQYDEQVALIESVGLSFRGVGLFVAGVTLGVGAVMGALGFGVRAGKMVPVMLSIMLAAVLLLIMGLAVLGGVVQGAASGSPLMLAQSCFPFLLSAAMVLLLVWLIRAARNAPHLTYARQLAEYQATHYQQAREFYQHHAAAAPQTGTQPGTQPAPPSDPPHAPPAASAGGYHQYPVSQPAPPQSQPAPPPGPAASGDSSDGPPAQG